MTTKTVLVMDDSVVVLETLKAVLEANGYAVRTAGNLADLERHRKECQPDLFVLDVQMPEAFGDDIGELLRVVHKVNVPILLFSSLDERLLAERVERAAIDGYVPKSAGIGALLQRIDSMLGKPAS
jgi:DNA-binding response OmpR family regulator